MNHGNGHRRFYYPGCSLMVTNRAYDVSARSVARALGIEMAELDDWNCCGATAYVATNEMQSFVLSARNLALAEAQNGGSGAELVVACNGCYVSLHKTEKYLAEHPALREKVGKALRAGGMEYRGQARVRHLLDILVNDVGEEKVRQRVTRPLRDLRVAGYPGCQLMRPFGEIDDPEVPLLLDRLLGWLGAQVVPFPLRAKCCGGMMMTTRPEMGRQLAGKLLLNAKGAGANCMATACPLCQINLEAYQDAVSGAVGADCHLPALYFTQLMGLAFGLSAEDLAWADSLAPLDGLPLEARQ